MVGMQEPMMTVLDSTLRDVLVCVMKKSDASINM